MEYSVVASSDCMQDIVNRAYSCIVRYLIKYQKRRIIIFETFDDPYDATCHNVDISTTLRLFIKVHSRKNRSFYSLNCENNSFAKLLIPKLNFNRLLDSYANDLDVYSKQELRDQYKTKFHHPPHLAMTKHQLLYHLTIKRKMVIIKTYKYG